MRRFVTALLPLFLSAAPPAQAENLRLVTIEAAPWASVDPRTGRPAGVLPSVIEDIRSRTGLEIDIALRPLARVLPELKSGHQDCGVVIWQDDWAEHLVKGERLALHPGGVIARRGLKLQNAEDLRTMQISVLRGLKLGSRFDDDPAIRRDTDTDYQSALRKMAAHRADAVAGALPTIRYIARQEGLADILGDQLVISEWELRFQCAKGSARLDQMPAIDQAIRDMVKDGTMGQIWKAYSFY